MDAAYLLYHIRKDDEYTDDAKLIGVYRSEAAARAAIVRVETQPGFRDYPEGFVVERYPLDVDHWTEGFVDLSDEQTIGRPRPLRVVPLGAQAHRARID
jgi:hypothetical protein